MDFFVPEAYYLGRETYSKGLRYNNPFQEDSDEYENYDAGYFLIPKIEAFREQEDDYFSDEEWKEFNR